jgi:hypothetical protein
MRQDEMGCMSTGRKERTYPLSYGHLSAISRAGGGRRKDCRFSDVFIQMGIVLYCTNFGLRSIMDALHCERFDGIYMKKGLWWHVLVPGWEEISDTYLSWLMA